jgi:hypothetical protein
MSDRQVDLLFSSILALIAISLIIIGEWQINHNIQNDPLRKTIVENGLKEMVHTYAVLKGMEVTFLRILIYLFSIPLLGFCLHVNIINYGHPQHTNARR